MSKADRILNNMISEMPYEFNEKMRPYVLEAMEINCNQQIKEQLEKIMKDWKRLKPFIAMDLTKGVDEYMLDNWVNELEQKLKQ